MNSLRGRIERAEDTLHPPGGDGITSVVVLPVDGAPVEDEEVSHAEAVELDRHPGESWLHIDLSTPEKREVYRLAGGTGEAAGESDVRILTTERGARLTEGTMRGERIVRTRIVAVWDGNRGIEPRTGAMD